MNQRYDVVSRRAAALLPAIDTSWFDSAGRPVALLVGLAIVALVALIVAVAAYGNDTRRRRRGAAEDDSELFTTTPLPMPKEELARMRQASEREAYGSFRLPKWVQAGSLLVACGITYFAAQRLRTDEAVGRARDDSARAAESRNSIPRNDPDDNPPESLDRTPNVVAPFSFRAREFVAAHGGCMGRLEVTKPASDGWNLKARVHDDRGQLIDTALARVSALRTGDVVEFEFRRTSCGRIGAWDVTGDRRTPQDAP